MNDSGAAARSSMTAWGAFFEVTHLAVGSLAAASAQRAGCPGGAGESDDTAWRPLGADLASSTVMRDWLARARERMAGARGVAPTDVDARALGAVLHLGVCARVLSPWIGLAVLETPTTVPRLDELWWRDDGTTMFPLGVQSTTDVASHAGRTETTWDSAQAARDIVERLALPLTATRLTTSPEIAWGNVASAFHGAARAVAAVDARQAHAAAEIAGACLSTLTADHPDGERLGDGVIGATSFRRRSCCQLYRLPGGSRHVVCGDCVLRERTGRRDG